VYGPADTTGTTVSDEACWNFRPGIVAVAEMLVAPTTA
jgi:hypothetical protein